MDRREDFTILQDGKAVYLDHAASSLTPDCVLDAMQAYYQQFRANVSRGVYSWSERATLAYIDAREKIANFVGASGEEVVLTSGATEGINIIANAYLKPRIKPGQVILLSPLEHHANMLPWQQVAKACQCKLVYMVLNDDFTINWRALQEQVDTLDIALIAVTHASNVLGVKNDILRLCQFSIPVLVDGTQMVSHEPVDVQALGCAFYVWSSHKMYGPTGCGALYIHKHYHQDIMPYHTGGGIVDQVDYYNATLQKGIHRLEPGTPNIAGVLGFAQAADYISMIGFEKIRAHELQLMSSLQKAVSGLDLITFGPHQHPVFSFHMQGVHPHDIATILGDDNIMVRAGHHCCMPLMKVLGVQALTRLSMGLYTQEEDIHRFVTGIHNVRKVMQI